MRTSQISLMALILFPVLALLFIYQPTNKNVTDPYAETLESIAVEKEKNYINTVIGKFKEKQYNEVTVHTMEPAKPPKPDMASDDKKFVEVSTYDFDAQKQTDKRVEPIILDKFFTLEKEYGFLAGGGKIIPIYSDGEDHLLILKPRNHPNIRLSHEINEGNSVDIGDATMVPMLVPKQLYDWAMESDCCNDCWEIHRDWGIPCAVDHACCMNACGIQPGCGESGPGDGGGGGIETPGGSGTTCKEGTEPWAGEVQVEMGGTVLECDFVGSITTAMVDGNCTTAYNGTFTDCMDVQHGGADIPETQQEYF